jgi:prepilin peptidase CpaA
MNEAIAMRLVLTVILVGLGFYDLWRARVPNLIVLPLLVVTLPLNAVRVWHGTLDGWDVALLAVGWLVCLLLWAMRAFGGGDVKLMMALLGLFPEARMVLTLLLGLLVGLLLVLISSEGRAGLRRLGALFFTAAQGLWPTREEIQAAYLARGRRITWVIALAGLVYLWVWPA